MLQSLRHSARIINPLIARHYWVNRSPFDFPTNVFHELQRMGKEMERMAGFRPFQQHPTSSELFRLQNPIVETDGEKKFHLEFDVRRFKPEEVKISTDSKDCSLSIEAKHKDENCRFEYFRKVSIPEGVNLKEITCNYKSNGALQLEAPYTEPAEQVETKDTPLGIDHK